MTMKILSLASLAFLLGIPLMAGETLEKELFASDKWQYTPFNPTPRSFMREMSTDRPDKTESPYTVDAGHFQVETDLVGFGIDNRNANNERVFGINAGNMNLKAGLLNNIDLQLVVENYIYEQAHAEGVTTRKSGFLAI